ncbi:MAG: hypothetical protein K9G39_02155 [Chlorobium sp.]|uniref:hypothetical protein n=1 Tax=Chlorobium sp. TaxID=1095 RepID=UPI0025B9743C|nr:hypothetical protein [Chlorobium sp.]MCF8382386.1 hypothetical protein [Chlorobium sp.]
MPKYFSVLFSFVFLLFLLQGCDRYFDKTVEGRLDMEVALRGFSLEHGVDIDNRNFIVQDDVAYELVFLSDTWLKNFSASTEGIAIPVPSGVGTVRLEPGALYRVKGKTGTTGERYRDFPVVLLQLRSIEYLGSGSGDGGLHIHF